MADQVRTPPTPFVRQDELEQFAENLIDYIEGLEHRIQLLEAVTSGLIQGFDPFGGLDEDEDEDEDEDNPEPVEGEFGTLTAAPEPVVRGAEEEVAPVATENEPEADPEEAFRAANEQELDGPA